jgi:orotidine-5'-phosphate decarboxylase
MTKDSNAERLLCAIDTIDLDSAVTTAESLKGLVGGIKLGLEFFSAHGPAGVTAIAACGLPIFLDLKFFDIPNTVAGAIRGTSGLNPFMLTVHIGGGDAMLRAAMAASSRLASQNDGRRPLVIGISVLTSFDEADIEAVGVRPTLSEQVNRLAAMALANGLDGVVCSAHEIADLRNSFGDELKLVAPGIRPAWSSADDQKRIVTPAEALRLGADYLVIGRPITRAEDPPAAARRILDEMAGLSAP